MANDKAGVVRDLDWRRCAMVQGEMTQCVDRERREYVENLAEAKVSLRERQEEIDRLEKQACAHVTAIKSMRDVIDRARNIIRSQHLQLKPKHRQRLNAKDAGLQTGEKNSLADAWCPVCAVLLEMDGGIR